MSPPLIMSFPKNRQLRDKICAQHGRLLRIARSWCHDQMLAEDLAQETIVRALSKMGSLREEAKLEVWLMRVMVNLFRDMHRKKEAIVGIDVEPESEADTPEQSLERVESINRVRAAMGKLNEGQRQIIALVDIAEFSYADTASILAVPVGTVMSRLCRARRSLRSSLERAARQPLGVAMTHARQA